MSERGDQLRALALGLLRLADDIDRDAGEVPQRPSPEFVSEIMSRSVDELDVDVRAANSVAIAGIKTIGELATLASVQTLWRVRGCGLVTVRRLHDAITGLGIKPTWKRP